MVKEVITDGSGNAVELEGEGDGDTLEVRGLCFSQCSHDDQSELYNVVVG